MRRPLLPPVTRLARRLARDESGNVIIYVSVSAALLLGIVGLALDSSRLLITHSEAQAAADAAALAGASQLDGQSGACARAKAEATAVTNQKRFATGGNAPTTGYAAVAFATANMRCLNTLPASDGTAIPNGADASDLSSRYIQVTTEQLTHDNTLLDALSSQTTATVQRKAVAGFRRSLCAAAPVMMVCDTIAWTQGVAFDAWSNYGGNKGFISNCGPNSNCIQNTLASIQPSFCLSDSSLVPQVGNHTNKAQTGINTRFGQGSTTADPSDTDIVDFGAYSSEPTPAGAKSVGANWNCQQYFQDFHSSDGLAKPASCSTTETTTTRYSVYQAERAANKIPMPGPSGLTTTAERRLLYLSIFDCTNPSVPEAFLKTFMIGPATGTSTKTIYVEALGLVTSKTDPTVLHEEVQLYR